MNRKAAEFGMKSTHFNNPHGLPSDGHVKRRPAISRKLASRRVQVAGLPQGRVHAAARLHARLGNRLSAQHRVAEHQPIVANRRLRRYKNRHHERGRELPRVDGERDGRRIIVVVLGAPSTRRPLRRLAKSVSLGLERSGENRRRQRENRKQSVSKAN